MIDQIKPLWEQKLSNREIARQLGINHKTVAAYLKKAGLKCNTANQPIQYSENGAICSKCNQEKPLIEFLFGRKGQKYEYRFSYCTLCRKKQLYLNLNNSLSSFIADKVRRIKIRANEYSIPFDLDLEYVLWLYEKQKGKCIYTLMDLKCSVGKGLTSNSLSFDKIVPEKGYVKGNIVLCSNRANTIKSDQTLDELKEWMPLWYERLICAQMNYGDF